MVKNTYSSILFATKYFLLLIMEIETLSDEIPANDYYSNNEMKNCMICQVNFDKFDSTPNLCDICLKKICESCSIHQENLKKYCIYCNKYILFFNSIAFQKLQVGGLINNDLALKINKLQVEIQEYKTKHNSVNIADLKIFFEQIQEEILQSSEMTLEMIAEICILCDEKNKSDIMIIEKGWKIDNLVDELSKAKWDLLEFKQSFDALPQGCGELYLENFELKGKIKELEQEHNASTHQIIESLETLKTQISKEKYDHNEALTKINARNLKELEESLEIERQRIRELEEELRFTKEQTEDLIRNKATSRKDEISETESQEDPAVTPCKCIIY